MFSSKTKNRLIIMAAIVIICSMAVVAAFALDSSKKEQPVLNIEGTNLSFKDSFYVIYAVSHNDIDDISNINMLIWTSAQNEYSIGTEDALLTSDRTEEVNGEKCLIFNYKDIDAKEMTKVIYARAYYKDGENVFYSDVKKYSVLNYAYNKLGYTGEATDNEALKDLLIGMLDYGASAQLYFDHNIDDLANEKHVMITLENGSFADGSTYELVLPGTELKATADDKEHQYFIHWIDGNGNVISDSRELTVKPGENNEKYIAVYEIYNGGIIEGAGANLNSSSFAMTEKQVDISSAVEVTSDKMKEIISKFAFDSKVYKITDDTPFVISSNLDAEGTVIIAPAGVVIKDSQKIIVSNLTVVGNFNISNSSNISLSSVGILAKSEALTIDSSSYDISITDSRIIAEKIAINNKSDNLSINDSYVLGEKAIISFADSVTVYNNNVVALDVAVTVGGNDNAVGNNTVYSGADGIGILVEENSLNTLVSFNNIEATYEGISILSSLNTSVLFNSAYNISAENNTNIYIVKNSIGNKIRLSHNNYLLCDSNIYVENNKDHTPETLDNTNFNGDSITDVNERAEVGANEDILPHTNKDLFIDMERKTTVKDISGSSPLPLNEYIVENSKQSKIVIVPPGCYYTTTEQKISFSSSACNDTEIYAYGVYNEHEYVINKDVVEKKLTNYIMTFAAVKNITVHGITQGYDYQSSGQVHVLDKLDENKILVIPAAGYDISAGFGQSNPDVFHASYATKFGGGTLYPKTGGASYTFVSANDDGTLILKLSSDSSYEAMNVGDIITCRMGGDNQHSVQFSGSNNIKMKDCTLYGYSAALAIVSVGASRDISLERVHNTSRSPFIIDKETYDMYAALEEKYNVDLEIYQDEQGRYRGAQPRIGSVDATHVAGTENGMRIESCLFENMCDDGSNQRGSSSRLSGLVDNGDGTSTIYSKGMVTSTYHGIYVSAGSTSKTLTPNSFTAGQRIYVYTSSGKLVCDTTCLTSSYTVEERTEVFTLGPIKYYIYHNAVTVPTEDVNFDVLDGYDLNDNGYGMIHKVLVDNLSRCSAGFYIDNLLVQNSTSRGVLVKTIDATITKTTFRNVASTGNLLSVETSWGESTVSKNITITDCLFDHTGFSAPTDPIKAPIAISSLSTYGNANIDTLQSHNILIQGCEFRNYEHNFGIYVNGAQDVRIIDNVFDPSDSVDPGNFIKIVTALNILIEGNKYKDPNGQLTTIKNLDVDDFANIHGSDVGNDYHSDCDIYIDGDHITNYRIVPQNTEDYSAAVNFADKLGNICGYSLSASKREYDKMIMLVVNDSDDEKISDAKYTVSCDDGILTITAQTRSALMYAVEDFIAYIESRNKNEQSISFNDGYSKTSSFALTEYKATDTSAFKHTGMWKNNGGYISSLTDADYIEFVVSGRLFTLCFKEESDFRILIDGNEYASYEDRLECTVDLEEGIHNVRVVCEDTSSPISFAGIKTYSAEITKNINKEHYIQFIGDSMVDSNNSFAHHIGNTLDWDYSVVVGNPADINADICRNPDIVVVFMGTDAINDSTSQADINSFVTKYKNIVKNIYSRYGYNTKVYAMQAISTSNPDNMFDISSKRYTAINSAVSYLENVYGDTFDVISASEIFSWDIEFNESIDATRPTTAGNYAIIRSLSKYILDDFGADSYINHTFEFDVMRQWQTTGQYRGTEMNEDGVDFLRFNFKADGHVFISGNDYANKIVIDSGHYLVVKYRSSGEASISFNLRTNDYGTNLPESGKGYVSSMTKPSMYAATEWEVAVIDLEQFIRYTLDTNIGVQVRITTSSETIDLAYVGIVDTLAEARMVTMFELGDPEYTYYSDWSRKGERISLTGEKIEEEVVDLSFVNYMFNIMTMRKWHNGKGFSYADQMLLEDPDGTVYSRFLYTSTGHMFFKGDNKFVPLNGSTGRYLLLKYRADNNDGLTLQLQTSNFEFNSTYAHVTMGSVAKKAANVPTEWEVAVIDLKQFEHETKGYKCDSDLEVIIRFTTGVNTLDIAYAAIVDSLDEAFTYLDYLGEDECVIYTDWSKAGTVTEIK